MPDDFTRLLDEHMPAKREGKPFESLLDEHMPIPTPTETAGAVAQTAGGMTSHLVGEYLKDPGQRRAEPEQPAREPVYGDFDPAHIEGAPIANISVPLPPGHEYTRRVERALRDPGETQTIHGEPQYGPPDLEGQESVFRARVAAIGDIDRSIFASAMAESLGMDPKAVTKEKAREFVFSVFGDDVPDDRVVTEYAEQLAMLRARRVWEEKRAHFLKKAGEDIGDGYAVWRDASSAHKYLSEERQEREERVKNLERRGAGGLAVWGSIPEGVTGSVYDVEDALKESGWDIQPGDMDEVMQRAGLIPRLARGVGHLGGALLPIGGMTKAIAAPMIARGMKPELAARIASSVSMTIYGGGSAAAEGQDILTGAGAMAGFSILAPPAAKAFRGMLEGLPKWMQSRAGEGLAFLIIDNGFAVAEGQPITAERMGSSFFLGWLMGKHRRGQIVSKPETMLDSPDPVRRAAAERTVNPLAPRAPERVEEVPRSESGGTPTNIAQRPEWTGVERRVEDVGRTEGERRVATTPAERMEQRGERDVKRAKLEDAAEVAEVAEVRAGAEDPRTIAAADRSAAIRDRDASNWALDFAEREGRAPTVKEVRAETGMSAGESKRVLRDSEPGIRRRIEAPEAEAPQGRAQEGVGEYPTARDVVDGRRVREGPVDNVESISASLNEYEVQRGIREVPMSDFEVTGKHYSVEGNKRIERLAEEIKASEEISPLIVVEHPEGPYILEGGTRIDALKRVGAKSFPALVVRDVEAFREAPQRQAPEAVAPKLDTQNRIIREEGEGQTDYLNRVARLRKIGTEDAGLAEGETAIGEYVRGGSRLNRALRAGTEPDPGTVARIQRLDAELETAPNYEGTVYRDVVNADAGLVGKLSGLKPGDTYRDPAYQSASKNDVNQKKVTYGKDEQRVVLEIRGGAKDLTEEAGKVLRPETVEAEGEVLIPRDTPLRVVSKTEGIGEHGGPELRVVLEPVAVAPKPREPWEMTRGEFVGEKPPVKRSAERWNEEAFFLDEQMEATNVSEPIHRGKPKNLYRSGKGRNEYAIADDAAVPGRALLMQRFVKEGGEAGEWSPVGEWHRGNMGVAEAYRGEGVGVPFMAEVAKRGYRKGPSIGYSPAGLKTVERAHERLVAEAVKAGKPVPAEVLAEYPDLAPKPDVAAPKTAHERLRAKRAGPVEPTVQKGTGTPDEIRAEIDAIEAKEQPTAGERLRLKRLEASLPEAKTTTEPIINPDALEASLASVRGKTPKRGAMKGPERGAVDIKSVAALPLEIEGAIIRAPDVVLEASDKAVRRVMKDAAKLPGPKHVVQALRAAKEVVAEKVRPHVRGREFRSRTAEWKRERALAAEDASNAVRDLSSLEKGKPVTDAQAEATFRWFSGEATDAELARTTSGDYLKRARYYKNLLVEGQRRQRDLGWMSEETLKEWEGRWLPRMFEQIESARKGSGKPGRPSKRAADMHMRRDRFIVRYQEGGEWRVETFPDSPDGRTKAESFKRELELDKQAAKMRSARATLGRPQLPGARKSGRGKLGEITLVEPLSKETRERLGEYRDPAALVAVGLMSQRANIAALEFLGKIAKNPRWVRDTQADENFHENAVPNDPRRFGAIAGKHLARSVRRDVMGMVRDKVPFLDTAAGISDTMLSQWKWGKTAGNPGTHGRNVLGNFMFMYLDGMNPLDASNLKHFAEGARIFRSKPGSDVHELKRFLIREGIIGGDYLSSEIIDVMDQVMKHRGGNWHEKVKGYVKDKGKGFKKGRVFTSLPGADSMSRAYAAEDILPKVAAFVKKVRSGMDPHKAAHEVRDRYPTYDAALTQKLMNMRGPVGAGLRQLAPPFMTFTAEAGRILSHAAARRPVTMAALYFGMREAVKAMAEAAGLDEETLRKAKAVAPDYREPGVLNWVLPWRGPNGEVRVSELSYTIPLGNEVRSILKWVEGDDPLEGAGLTSAPTGPAFALAGSLIFNKNLFTGRAIDPSGGEDAFTAVSDAEGTRRTWRFIGESMLPSLFPGVGYNWRKLREAWNQTPIDLEGKVTRDLTLTALDTLAGVKIREIDIDHDEEVKVRRINTRVGKKLNRVGALLRDNRIPEADRRREYDELKADITELYNEYLDIYGMLPVPSFEGVTESVRAKFEGRKEPRERRPRGLLLPVGGKVNENLRARRRRRR